MIASGPEPPIRKLQVGALDIHIFDDTHRFQPVEAARVVAIENLAPPARLELRPSTRSPLIPHATTHPHCRQNSQHCEPEQRPTNSPKTSIPSSTAGWAGRRNLLSSRIERSRFHSTETRPLALAGSLVFIFCLILDFRRERISGQSASSGAARTGSKATATSRQVFGSTTGSLDATTIPCRTVAREPRPHDAESTRMRHRIENRFSDIKQFRGSRRGIVSWETPAPRSSTLRGAGG